MTVSVPALTRFAKLRFVVLTPLANDAQAAGLTPPALNGNGQVPEYVVTTFPEASRAVTTNGYAVPTSTSIGLSRKMCVAGVLASVALRVVAAASVMSV